MLRKRESAHYKRLQEEIVTMGIFHNTLDCSEDNYQDILRQFGNNVARIVE